MNAYCKQLMPSRVSHNGLACTISKGNRQSTGDEGCEVWLTLLDLCPLPLSNAGPAGICKDCATDLGEGIQHAITFNGGSAASHLALDICCRHQPRFQCRFT